MKPIYADGIITEGRLKLANPSQFKATIAHLKGEVRIKVFKKEKPRSLNQNSYYWGVVIKMICDSTGEMEPERVHDALKMKFWTIPVGDGRFGRALLTPGSTTDMSTVQFEEYVEKCRLFAAQELNITIPIPGEY